MKSLVLSSVNDAILWKACVCFQIASIKDVLDGKRGQSKDIIETARLLAVQWPNCLAPGQWLPWV